MSIIGFDVALEMSGYCVMGADDSVEALSTIRTTKNKTTTPTESLRHKAIFEKVMGLLSEHKPAAAVIENQHIGRLNKKTGMSLSRVRGVFQLACTLQGIPVYTLEPSEIKNGVGCKGNADKDIIQSAVLGLYGEQALVHERLKTFIPKGKNKTDDMADALAMVHTFKTDPGKAILT